VCVSVCVSVSASVFVFALKPSITLWIAGWLTQAINHPMDCRLADSSHQSPYGLPAALAKKKVQADSRVLASTSMLHAQAPLEQNSHTTIASSPVKGRGAQLCTNSLTTTAQTY
jgi:hypothetical protein